MQARLISNRNGALFPRSFNCKISSPSISIWLKMLANVIIMTVWILAFTCAVTLRNDSVVGEIKFIIVFDYLSAASSILLLHYR